MKRALFWVGVALVIGVAAGASYLWPNVLIWVAWAQALLCWYVAHFYETEWKRAEVSRDRWRGLHGRMEGQRDKADRLISELADALESQRIMLNKRDAEIERLKGDCDRLQAECVGAYESHSFAQQRADRYEDFIQWLKKKGYITVALIDQFMKLEEA